MKKAKILVTGAAGLVGSHLCDQLLANGYQVIGIDNFFRGVPGNLKAAKRFENFRFIEGDILNINSLKIGKVDLVYHMAAIVATQNFYKMPVENFEVNALGTKKVLDYAKKAKIKKIILGSTSEIYGTHPLEIPTKETTPSVLESPHLTSRYSYAVSKLAAEHLSIAYRKYFDVVIMRYANIYGPRDTGIEHVIPIIIDAVLKNKTLTLHRGAKKKKRTFLYVDDCVQATILAMGKGKSGEVFNVGSDEEITIHQLALKIFEILKKKAKIKYIKPRPYDPVRRVLDVTQLKKKLQYEPTTTLEEGIIKTAEWMKDYP